MAKARMNVGETKTVERGTVGHCTSCEDEGDVYNYAVVRFTVDWMGRKTDQSKWCTNCGEEQ